MVTDIITGKVVDSNVVIKEMQEHVLSGKKLIFSANQPYVQGEIIIAFELPFRVIRLSTREEYLQHYPNGNTTYVDPCHYYFAEVEVAD